MSAPGTPRVAVVTGAASGIGLAIATRLVADGHAVAIFDLDADGAETAAERLHAAGHAAIACRVDVAERDAIDASHRRSA